MTHHLSIGLNVIGTIAAEVYGWVKRILPGVIAAPFVFAVETKCRLEGGMREVSELRLLSGAIAKGHVVIEVGAGTGLMTKEISRMVGDEGVVVALEPNPGSFSVLKMRCKSLRNVHPIRAAAGSRDTLATLWFAGVGDTGGSILLRRGRPSTVRMTRIDSLRDELGLDRIDALVVDAEGYEAEVLIGAGMILKFLGVTLVEVHDSVSPNLYSKICQILGGFGLVETQRLIELDSPRITVHLFLRESAETTKRKL
jgi:FkbM family methyltransferase